MNVQQLIESLSDAWTEWLGGSRDALLCLHEQTAAMVLGDDDRLVTARTESETRLNHLRRLDEHAASLLSELSHQVGAGPAILDVARALPKAEGERLHMLANRVTSNAREMQAVMEKNYRMRLLPEAA